eukprot:TRINITY_DN203_c0_g1_i1.p1 TRINITY_DN203_c0_g1~~TRINITY_DN203_c0_g1_i1.p1  ORF type:complete len:208 (-),score=34.53 TRINITY_DN203_c0_g1_i1:336-959(-)
MFPKENILNDYYFPALPTIDNVNTLTTTIPVPNMSTNISCLPPSEPSFNPTPYSSPPLNMYYDNNRFNNNWTVIEVTHTTPRLPMIFPKQKGISRESTSPTISINGGKGVNHKIGEFCANRECYQRVIRNDKLRSPYCSDKCQTREQNLRQGRVKPNSKEIQIKECILSLNNSFIPGLPDSALPFIHQYVDNGLPINCHEIIARMKK